MENSKNNGRKNSKNNCKKNSKKTIGMIIRKKIVRKKEH